MLKYAKPASWHRDRQRGLGGTDAAAILGVGFRDAQDVYESKVASEPKVTEPSERMLHGIFNEGYIAEKYQHLTGVELEEPPAILFHPDVSYRLCSPDRFAKLGKKRRRMVEFKSVYGAPGSEWGDLGTDEIPDGYMIQVQHDLDVCLAADAVTEEEAELIVNFVGYDTRIYLIERRPSLMGKVKRIEADFWKRVESRDAEAVANWKHPLASDVANEIAFSRPGTKKKLGDEALPFAEMIDAAALQKKTAEKTREEAKRKLLSLLDGYESGILPDGRTVRAKMTQRKGYVVEPTEFMDFRILKGKASDGDE